VLEVLRTSWRRVLLAGGAFTVVNTTFYIYITFMQDYGVRILHMPKSTVLLAIAIVSVLQIPALAGFAAISDRIGRRKMYLPGRSAPRSGRSRCSGWSTPAPDGAWRLGCSAARSR